MAVMYYQGLRPGEVTGLTWDVVDFRHKTVAIRQSRKLLPDKRLELGPTKADSDRVLRIFDDPDEPCLAALKAHKTVQKRERLAAPAWEDQNVVFCNEIGRPIDPSNLRREVTRICKAAGVEPISPNELRHTRSSVLIDRGWSKTAVADFLGHANTRRST